MKIAFIGLGIMGRPMAGHLKNAGHATRAEQHGFHIRLHQKDLNLALQAGRELGVALPNTASTQQLFAAVAAAGGGDLDHSGLVKALETLAAHPVAPDA